MTGSVSMTFRDYNNETSIHSMDIPDLTAANFDAYVDTSGLIPDYYDAVNGITVGNIGSERISARDILVSQAPAGSVWAQVEMKWLVFYTDTVTAKVYRREIPTPDLTLLVAGTDLLNIASGAGLTWKNAAEALWVSPDNNPITIFKAQLVGRNN